MRRTLVAALTVLLVSAPAAQADGGHGGELREYAKGTWASFEAMTDERSGLPADVLEDDGDTSVQTSTTNIGAYLWSAVAAEELGFLRKHELVARLSTTLSTLERMERHAPSGQFYNWYDHHTGAKLTTWPPTGEPRTPILSSVDNGWLATGLKIVENTVPQLSRRAGKLYDSMNFGFYYRPDVNRILFHYEPDTGAAPCCYDTVVSESRIADYIGIAQGQIPGKAYYGRNRSWPDTCDAAWTETKPVGAYREYLGVRVFEGALPYAGMQVVPSWSGSMFEALMPDLFVPEDRWAPKSWGENHPLTVRSQIHHGLREAGYGYWGFSPSNIPEGGYGVFGVDGIGTDPGGAPSGDNQARIDRGWEGCPNRPALPDPPQSAYTHGTVTPHAAFLGLRYAPREALDNLRRLRRDFPALYGKWGFKDSVNVGPGERRGTVSPAYLSLDQGMIMAALSNALSHDLLRRAFADRELERALRPVIGIEKFATSR